MARANYIKKARKRIYVHGRRVTYEGMKGTKRQGLKITKTDHTLPENEKDIVLVEIGESYWWWQFKNSPVMYSRTKPRRSQLTRSEFLGWLYDLQDEIAAFNVEDVESYDSSDLEATRDEWVSQIEEQHGELEGKKDNMPEGLRDNSPTADLLQERMDALESWQSDLEAVDLDFSDEDLKQEAEDEWSQQHTAALIEADPDVLAEKEEWVQERFLELKRDKVDDLIQSLQDCECSL